MIRYLSLLVAVAAMSALVATPAFAPPNNKGGSGSAASSKAVFSNNSDGLEFLSFDPGNANDPETELCVTDGPTEFDPPNVLCTPWMKLFDLKDALKTSSTGALEAVLSMECALWTNTEVTVANNSTKNSGARAGIEVRVKVDGTVMSPGIVVYCDRLQFIEFTVPNIAHVTGSFILRLFQRTKNSHAYHFYKPMENVELHDILVEVRGIVRCFKDGGFVVCDDAGIDPIGFSGVTKAVIGKSTLVVEEHQNWRVMEDGV